MNKGYHSEGEQINLHTIRELQEIHVRDGVTLRLLAESDASRILEILAADKNIRNRVTVASHIFTPEDVVKEVDEYRKDINLIRYVIVEEDNVVGIISLWRDDGFFGTPPNFDDYGFGYFLDPMARGKGLVSDAIKSLMNIVRNNLPVRQFVAFCEADNTNSMAVLSKLGFKPTGRIFNEPTNGWKEEKFTRQL